MARLALAIGVATLVAAIPAGAGTHDPGFGSGGWVRVGGGYDTVAAIAVRKNGRIVVLTGAGFLQQRLPDGALDRTFRVGHYEDPCGCATAMLALQPDGSSLVAEGTTVVRVTTTGRRDTTFRVSLGQDPATDIATLPDGRFIVATTTGTLRRFLPNGGADRTFTVRVPPGGARIAIQHDGATLVAEGTAGIARYLADGSRDPAFDTSSSSLAGDDVDAVAVQPDGKILAAGVRIVSGQGPQTEVFRLLPDGAPDTRFGTNGVATFRYQYLVGVPAAVVPLPDGAVGLVGSIYQTCPCKGAGWLALRVTADGHATALPVPGDGPDPDNDCWGGTAGALAVQPDGLLLVGGDMCDRGDSSAFVGRLLPSLELDSGPPLVARLTGVRVRKGRVTATLVLSEAANVTATIRRVHGSDVPLRSGSVLGGSTTIHARALQASFTGARRARLVLVFVPRRGAAYIVHISATDDRDRTADIRLPLG